MGEGRTVGPPLLLYMSKQIQFKHKTGSRKLIPGVQLIDCEPRLVQGKKYEATIAQYVDALQLDPTHVVKVNIPELPNVELNEAEKRLPQRIQERRLDAKADEYVRLEQYNETFMATLRRLERNGEICDLKVVDVSELEVAADAVASLDLAEIAWADYVDRGIEIPETLRSANADKIAGWEASRSRETVKPVTPPEDTTPVVPPVVTDPKPTTEQGSGDDTPPADPKAKTGKK